MEMYVYDAGNDEVEEAEEEASEMNAASSYAAKERILPAGEVEDTAELVDAYRLCATICFKRQSCGARRADTA